jgi:hypothetical protein
VKGSDIVAGPIDGEAIVEPNHQRGPEPMSKRW